MNRAERRKIESSIKKNTQIINKLTPEQAKLMDKISEQKANIISDKYIDKFGELIDRSMTAALLEFGLDLEESELIQKNMSELFQEDSIKIKKLEEGNIDMTKIELEVKAAIEGLLGMGETKKQDIETLVYKFPKLSKSMLLNAYAKVKKDMGLIENRIPREEVFAYLDKFADSTEVKKTVTKLMEKFGFTENTAKTYYSKWKIAYMQDKTSKDPLLEKAKVIIKDVTIETATPQELEKNVEKIIDTVKERQCLKSIIPATVQAAELINKVEPVEMKGLKVIEEKVIKTIKVEGENGVYAADTTTGVVLSRDNMIIGFGSLKELETWVREVKAVFAMVV